MPQRVRGGMRMTPANQTSRPVAVPLTMVAASLRQEAALLLALVRGDESRLSDVVRASANRIAGLGEQVERAAGVTEMMKEAKEERT